MKLFLIGFMGSGKSTWARRLADLLSISAYDLDQLLEEKYAMSISDQFKSWGETEFRKRESELLKNFTFDQGILACGGGTPCFHGNIEFMLSEGKVVYLQLSVTDLAERLRDMRRDRPVLADVSDEDLESKIQELMEKRAPFYAKAHVTIDTAISTPEEVIHMLNS